MSNTHQLRARIDQISHKIHSHKTSRNTWLGRLDTAKSELQHLRNMEVSHTNMEARRRWNNDKTLCHNQINTCNGHITNHSDMIRKLENDRASFQRQLDAARRDGHARPLQQRHGA